MMSVQRQVVLRGAVDVAQIRTATFEGSEHLVVPVVALVGDVVVTPQNSDGPELVPAEELARTPKGWDGRPVVPDHPDNGKASANEPETLEAKAFGRMFHTVYEDDKLKTDVYLNPARAAEVGPDAVSVVERLRNREMVEVSVGAWITAQESQGTMNGERYAFRWTNIVPDHLAMLPESATGACSIDMGCGAPRANQGFDGALRFDGIHDSLPAAELRAADKDRRKPMFYPKAIMNLYRSMKFWAGQEDEGVSDSQLREALDAALRAVEAGYEAIVDVFTDSSTVIYVTMPEDKFLWFRRTFSTQDDGSVELADDPVLVEPVTRYEVVAAQAAGSAQDPSAAKDGGCAQGDNTNDAGREGEPPMSEVVKNLVGGLISNEKTPFTEDDRAVMEGFSEERLGTLTSECEAMHVQPIKPESDDGDAGGSEGDQADPNRVQLSREEYDDMRASSQAFKAQQERAKARLVSALSKAQDEWDLEELQAMSVEQLEKTTRLLKLNEPEPDYGGRVLVDADQVDASIPPDGYDLKGLDARRKEAN